MHIYRLLANPGRARSLEALTRQNAPALRGPDRWMIFVGSNVYQYRAEVCTYRQLKKRGRWRRTGQKLPSGECRPWQGEGNPSAGPRRQRSTGFPISPAPPHKGWNVHPVLNGKPRKLPRRAGSREKKRREKTRTLAVMMGASCGPPRSIIQKHPANEAQHGTAHATSPDWHATASAQRPGRRRRKGHERASYVKTAPGRGEERQLARKASK